MAAHSSGVLLDTPHGKRSTPPRAETDGSIDAYRLLAGQTVNANSIFGFKSMLVAQPAFLQRFSPACGSCVERAVPCVCACAHARMRASGRACMETRGRRPRAALTRPRAGLRAQHHGARRQ